MALREKFCVSGMFYALYSLSVVTGQPGRSIRWAVLRGDAVVMK